MKKIITIFILILLVATISYAKIYKCVDENGNRTFSAEPGPGCTLLPGSVEKSLQHQPVKSASQPKPKIKPMSHVYTTKKGYFACRMEIWLDHMTKFVLAKDRESIKAYFASNKCLVMKPDLQVTMIDSPGLFGGKVSFIFQGVKFWTYREGLNYGLK